MRAVQAESVLFDTGENFEKMSYRNRYRISGANNPILLSVPLVKGRNQHIPMEQVLIHNAERWQTQHWRTLVSVYKRSPFFDYYETSLQQLFEMPFTKLVDFNRVGIQWTMQQLKLKFEMQETSVFVKEYPADIQDLRREKSILATLPRYHQIFEDRIGFQPDLSILDLLFSEGPAARGLLSR